MARRTTKRTKLVSVPRERRAERKRRSVLHRDAGLRLRAFIPNRTPASTPYSTSVHAVCFAWVLKALSVLINAEIGKKAHVRHDKSGLDPVVCDYVGSMSDTWFAPIFAVVLLSFAAVGIILMAWPSTFLRHVRNPLH